MTKWHYYGPERVINSDDMDGIYRLTARIGELEREVTELTGLVMVYKPVYESVLAAGREMPDLLKAYGLGVTLAEFEGSFDAKDVVE